MPARFKAFLHANVLAQEIGRPRHVNTRSECIPSCRRNTFTAVASGDVVIPFDADLQDPPELITTMLEKWSAG